MGAFVGLEDVDEFADQVPESADGSFARFAQHGFEAGEGLLDWIEVRAVGRQEAQGCACRFYLLPHCCALVARQVVHDDDVARSQFGHEYLRDIGFEPVAIDRPVQHHRCNHAGHAQTGHERGGLAMAVRVAHPQALALGATAMAAGHVGGGPRLIDEDKALRLQIDLAVEPALTLPQDVGTVLLDRVAGLFLRVIPCRAKKRCTVPIPTEVPRSMIRA